MMMPGPCLQEPHSLRMYVRSHIGSSAANHAIMSDNISTQAHSVVLNCIVEILELRKIENFHKATTLPCYQHAYDGKDWNDHRAGSAVYHEGKCWMLHSPQDLLQVS